MPTLTDFRSDFRKGRTGSGLRIRQEAKSYTSSVRDANNCMVLADGRIGRRWGTKRIETLADGDTRIEPWYYSSDDQYLLLFSNAKLIVKEYNSSTDSFTTLSTFTSQPWTNTTKDFLSIAFEGDTMVICDETFKTKVLTRMPQIQGVYGPPFTLTDFGYGTNIETGRQQAPFYQFADNSLELTTNIFTKEGLSTGYESFLQAVTSGSFNLTNGTGTITSSADYFTTDHVGTRMRLLDGEFQITSRTSATSVEVTVIDNIAKRLIANPFYLKKDSTLVEVSFFNHGLEKGDQIFLAGISASDNSSATLAKAVKAATSATAAPSNSNAGAYTIKRILDADTFEIDGAGTAATNDVLVGGTGVLCFIISGIKGVREPAFSDARGWPTACAIHERRLWLGGTTSLVNAAWGSVFSQFRNFDLADGGVADAIALYGIGQQARIRHIVAAYDLMFFTDEDEIYVPGSTTEAISQGSVRIVSATEHGSSYTKPHKFDGGIFYIDKNGIVVREFANDSRITEYSSLPASVVVPDWIKYPKDSAVYEGAASLITTPYMFLTRQTDGAMLVLHSSRSDDSFGWMRWTLDYGSFQSVATLGNSVFCVAKRQVNLSNGTPSGSDEYVLMRFDTESENYITTDFTESFTGSSATAWTGAAAASRQQQAYQGYYSYPDVTVNGSGAFTTSTALTAVTIGDQMSWSLELHAPIANMPNGTQIGKKQRLVSAEISWEKAASGTVASQNVVTAGDTASDLAVVPVDEWREYFIGIWDREPTLKIEGTKAGRCVLRGVVLNVFV